MWRGKLLICLILFLVAAAFWGLVLDIEKKLGERKLIQQENSVRVDKEASKAKQISEDMWSRTERVKSRGEWEALLTKELPSLSREEQKIFGPLVRAKVFEANFWRVENLLRSARKLLEQNENHPVAKEYLKEAGSIYEKNGKLVENLVDSTKDQSLRTRLYYLLGVFYYRSLLLIDPKKDALKAKDLVENSIQHFDHVFDSLPKDRDTEVAIEVLQKNAKEVLSNLSSLGEGKTKVKLLPSGEITTGPFGIGEREHGRH